MVHGRKGGYINSAHVRVVWRSQTGEPLVPKYSYKCNSLFPAQETYCSGILQRDAEHVHTAQYRALLIEDGTGYGLWVVLLLYNPCALLPFLCQGFHNSFLGNFSRPLPSRCCLLGSQPLISKDFLDILPFSGMPAFLWQYYQTSAHCLGCCWYPEDETRQTPPPAVPRGTQIPAGVAVNNERNK
ncbi:unnamed protein product [Ectocarpus sp. 13 AM-2016]